VAPYEISLMAGTPDDGDPADNRARVDGEVLEREGDAAVYNGDMATAKSCFGQAIDAYLDDRDFDSAVKTCRKMIRVAPEVARARFTLTFLLIGMGELEEARRQLEQYADAVRAADAGGFAIPRLRLLAHATSDGDTRAVIQALIADFSGATDPPLEHTGEFDASTRWERVLDTVLRDAHH
jgi:hypothetical protein